MKKETSTYIFQLLKAFIFDEKPVLTGDPDWDEIFHYGSIHSVLGIIGYVITKYELCDDQIYAYKFESQMIGTYGSQYRKIRQMERLIEHLNENEIDHLLMKGFIVKDIYPVPELRYFGDVDFVIRKEDRVKTDLLMKELGYDSPENWEPVYTYKRDTEHYEIHTEVLDSDINEGKQREYYLDVWDHAYCVKDHTYRFERDYHFVYVISHLAKHASKRGAGLRMYLDIALYIKQYRNDSNWNYILEQLEILDLKRFFYTVCSVCAEWFNVSPPCEIERIDQETMEQFTELTLKGGLFGFAGVSDVEAVIKQAGQSESKAHVILNQIFPHTNELQTRYKYLQKHKWLLPVAWIDRIFRNRKLITKRIHTAVDIATADESELESIRELKNKTGLS